MLTYHDSHIFLYLTSSFFIIQLPYDTAEILHIFIRRVEVGERAEKYSRTAAQEIRIYYRDVGLVDELPQSIADAVTQEISDEVA